MRNETVARFKREDYVNGNEIAAAVGMRPQNLWRWIKNGTLPQPDFKWGNSKLWKKEVVGQFIERHRWKS